MSPDSAHRESESGSAQTVASDVPLLEVRGLKKSFGHVEALRGADLRVNKKEVVALLGDNGAGKSTLVKAISGALEPDSGEILLSGVPVHFDSPFAARDAGIETVYQDLALADDLSASANLFLGREVELPGLLGRFGFLDSRRMKRRSEEVFKTLGVAIPNLTAPVSGLSGGQARGSQSVGQ